MLLAVPQLLIDGIIWQPPRWMWPQTSLRNVTLDALSLPGRFYESLLPALQPPAASRLTPLLLFVIVLVASVLLASVLRSREARDVPTPSPEPRARAPSPDLEPPASSLRPRTSSLR